MFRKSVLTNQGIVNGSKKVLRHLRKATVVTQNNGGENTFSTATATPVPVLKADESDTVQNAIRILNDESDMKKMDGEMMTKRLLDFEVRSLILFCSLFDLLKKGNSPFFCTIETHY